MSHERVEREAEHRAWQSSALQRATERTAAGSATREDGSARRPPVPQSQAMGDCRCRTARVSDAMPGAERRGTADRGERCIEGVQGRGVATWRPFRDLARFTCGDAQRSRRARASNSSSEPPLHSRRFAPPFLSTAYLASSFELHRDGLVSCWCCQHDGRRGSRPAAAAFRHCANVGQDSRRRATSSEQAASLLLVAGTNAPLICHRSG